MVPFEGFMVFLEAFDDLLGRFGRVLHQSNFGGMQNLDPSMRQSDERPKLASSSWLNRRLGLLFRAPELFG
jgi:hypothetical protein